jgi:nitrite reductase/ring-hydroxylating ferredoxin subunit
MEDGFTAVAKVGDLAPGEMTFVAIDRERIVLANVDGRFYALRDVCGHRNAPLSRGRLDGHVIECPLHFAQFDIRTGKLIDGPVSADVPAYEVRVEDGTIYLRKPPTA